jgi:hypothetical protein
MYSTPSGCISCFTSKSKCTPLAHSNPARICQRCASAGTECRPFAPGTRLIACDACIDSRMPCTNEREGLRCDGCVAKGKSCSRVGVQQDALFIEPPLIDTSVQDETSFEEKEARTCNMCVELHQFCDGVEPACAVCKEVGLTCVYKQRATSPPPAIVEGQPQISDEEPQIAEGQSQFVDGKRHLQPHGPVVSNNIKPLQRGCERCQRRGLQCDGTNQSHCTSCKLAKKARCRWPTAPVDDGMFIHPLSTSIRHFNTNSWNVRLQHI